MRCSTGGQAFRITLALLYIEVARRAGLQVEGINFPGHFLLRCRARRGSPYLEDLIIDAFHGGALLSEDACRELLYRHAGADAVFESHLFARATKPQILARMLLNLKRVRAHALVPSGEGCHRVVTGGRSLGGATSSAIEGCSRIT